MLGLFLNVRAEEQPELYQDIVQLCTQHWHGRDTHTHATQLLPIYKLTAKYGYMTAPDFRKQLPFFLQLLIPIHCSKKRPNVLTHSFCVKKNLSLSLTDIQYLVSRFCCSAIQCCKISHFPFSFLFSKHYFVVVFDHLCMFAEHLPLCPPQV